MPSQSCRASSDGHAQQQQQFRRLCFFFFFFFFLLLLSLCCVGEMKLRLFRDHLGGKEIAAALAFAVAPQGCTTFLSPGWTWLLALVCVFERERARACLLLIF